MNKEKKDRDTSIKNTQEIDYEELWYSYSEIQEICDKCRVKHRPSRVLDANFVSRVRADCTSFRNVIKKDNKKMTSHRHLNNTHKINYDDPDYFYPYALEILRESLDFFKKNYPDDTHITGLTKDQNKFLCESDIKEESTIALTMFLNGLPIEKVKKLIRIVECLSPFLFQSVYHCNEIDVTHLGSFCRYVARIRVALKMHEEGMEKSLIQKYTSLEDSIIDTIIDRITKEMSLNKRNKS